MTNPAPDAHAKLSARSLLCDQRGAAGLFSVLTLLALVLAIGYTIGLANATLEKMRVQDAADATAYSGARTRGNLYQVMAFLNWAKMALHRRTIGVKLTDGEASILADLGRISGVEIDPALYDDEVIGLGGDVGEKALMYARLAEDMQRYIEDNFTAIIANEMRVVAEAHGCELLACSPGEAPEFVRESDTVRYWLWYEHLNQWISFERWDCDIMQAMYDPLLDPYGEPPGFNPVPGDPWTPRVIAHAMTHERNSIKVVLQRATDPNVVLPGVLNTVYPTVVGTSAAGCYCDALRSLSHSSNLYVTDFRARLLSLDSAKHRKWLNDNEPFLANEIPWFPELTVH